jgi:hypothetical protein
MVLGFILHLLLLSTRNLGITQLLLHLCICYVLLLYNLYVVLFYTKYIILLVVYKYKGHVTLLSRMYFL